MFLGLRTAIYHVDDIERGKNWYSQVLGFAPYFDQPFYVGFNVGGYELGLQPAESSGQKADGAVAYWGVENADAAVQRLIENGATIHRPVHNQTATDSSPDHGRAGRSASRPNSPWVSFVTPSHTSRPISD